MKILKYFRNRSKGFMTIVFFFGCLFFSLPKKTMAAEFYFYSWPAEVRAGDAFIVNLKISSPEEAVNALEGYLSFDEEKLEIKEISAGGSLFGLWPKQPNFSNEEGTANFIGGVANGFLGNEADVLKIIFNAKEEGQAFVSLGDNSSLFLNDGMGTQTSFTSRPIYLNISASSETILPRDEWRALMDKDNTPPEPFEVMLGRHPFIFSNQYFISFFTSDKHSGIDFYEVKEGNMPFERAVSPCLLKDQSLRSRVEVRAWDKAGNYRVVELAPAVLPAISFYKSAIFISFLVVLGGIILFSAIARFVKKYF